MAAEDHLDTNEMSESLNVRGSQSPATRVAPNFKTLVSYQVLIVLLIAFIGNLQVTL